ncbi:hypothetical protein [Streptomyces sp. NPDC093223]
MPHRAVSAARCLVVPSAAQATVRPAGPRPLAVRKPMRAGTE